MSLFSEAFAQATTTASTAAPAQEPSALMNLVPLAVIFGVFYIFLIRPQQKKFKEQADLINSLQSGDEVVTSGGIIAKITKVEKESNIVYAEIASGVEVRVSKATIVEVLKEAVK